MHEAGKYLEVKKAGNGEGGGARNSTGGGRKEVGFGIPKATETGRNMEKN